jgi:hypothetical protein
MGKACSIYSRAEKCILFFKHRGKIKIVRPRHDLEDNIKMDTEETG